MPQVVPVASRRIVGAPPRIAIVGLAGRRPVRPEEPLNRDLTIAQRPWSH